MTIIVDDALREICRQLLAEGWSESEWAAREADDWIDTDRYAGGFDADEVAFAFSRYADDGEVWFQFTLAQAQAIVAGEMAHLDARRPE